jgi:hypothetical protein
MFKKQTHIHFAMSVCQSVRNYRMAKSIFIQFNNVGWGCGGGATKILDTFQFWLKSRTITCELRDGQFTRVSAGTPNVTVPSRPLCQLHRRLPISITVHHVYTGGADKSLARPGSKQATATEDFEFHISYL